MSTVISCNHVLISGASTVNEYDQENKESNVESSNGTQSENMTVKLGPVYASALDNKQISYLKEEIDLGLDNENESVNSVGR